jgi:protein MBA1
VYKYRIYPQPRKSRPILATRTIPGVAKELHNALFTAYANGSKSTISKIAGETLAESLSTRLSNRAKGEKVLWSIMQYVSKPRLMSHRATELPFKLEGERAGVRQAVVRIHTQQSLRIGRAPQGKKKGSLEEPENSQKEEPFWGYGDNDANIEWGAERTKDVIEYVVLQRRLIKGKEEDWCLLGFVEPTTIADIRQWRAMAAGALAQEKAKKIKDKTRDAVPANAAPAA